MKCYRASFNVGNVEVWSSDLFFHKKDVITDIDMSLDEIAEEILGFSYTISEDEIDKILNRAVKSLKRNGYFEDKDKNLDFFIIDEFVWKDIIDREMYIQAIKVEDYGTD